MKRLFDVVVAVVALIVLSPLLVVVGIAVRITMGGPVLFRHQRPGLHGKPFQLIKFRTMKNTRGADGKMLPDEQRQTGFGRFLRATSIDELPELLNVLRGEMSLVGPRPLLMAYLPLYSAEEARRHDVVPGITGLAQVSGRNALSWPEKFKLDVRYVDTHTFWMDLKILAITVWRVFRRDGISSEGSALMPGYSGYDDSLT
jgi:sugar transferase EpsL